MEPGNIDANRFRTYLVIPVSLFVVWLVASLAPSQLEKVHNRLPSLNVDWDPNRPPYNLSKLALIIEDRPLAYLTPLLLHTMSVVPPDWPFLLVGSNDSLRNTTANKAVQMHEASGKLGLIEDPDAGYNVQRRITDRLLTNLTFYEQHVDPAEWLLVIHTDAILCARSENTMDDWLGYDWVGGRWSMGDQLPGSGGLSLRRVSRMKQVLQFQDWQDDGGPEDRWFTGRVGTLPDAILASPEVESRFCVQQIFHEKPMGFHVSSGGTSFHSDVWQDLEQRKKIYDWCPEIKMILDMKLERERCTEQDLSVKEKEAQLEAEEEEKAREEELKKAAAEEKKVADEKAAAEGVKKHKGKGKQKAVDDDSEQAAAATSSTVTDESEATATSDVPTETEVPEEEDPPESSDETEESEDPAEPEALEEEKAEKTEASDESGDAQELEEPEVEESEQSEAKASATEKYDPARILTVFERR